jgi:hypothetical protein
VNRNALLQVLREIRALLALPENSFVCSSWANEEAAITEIDGLIQCLCNGAKPDPSQLDVLFAPTGPIQEVSFSGGWAEAFLELAERFDEAMR